MANSKTRGEKLKETMLKKHGSEQAWRDWMRQNAAKGGSKKGLVKGFAAMTPEQRSEASRKGGLAKKGFRK